MRTFVVGYEARACLSCSSSARQNLAPDRRSRHHTRINEGPRRNVGRRSRLDRRSRSADPAVGLTSARLDEPMKGDGASPILALAYRLAAARAGTLSCHAKPFRDRANSAGGDGGIRTLDTAFD